MHGSRIDELPRDLGAAGSFSAEGAELPEFDEPWRAGRFLSEGMDLPDMQERVGLLEEEIRRLHVLRERFRAEDSCPVVDVEFARAMERIRCILAIAMVSLQGGARLLLATQSIPPSSKPHHEGPRCSSRLMA